MTIAYRVNGKIYLNLTNRCSNACSFCVRNQGDFGTYNLWLDREPTLEETIAALGEMQDTEEIVFCGYGEPLYRMDIIPAVCDYAHAKGKKTRMNTNGQDSLINGGGSAEKLAGKLDTVSISLNAATPARYCEICAPAFGEEAFASLLDFAKDCKGRVPRVVLSIVDVVGEEEVKKAQAIADALGIELRVRHYQIYSK